MTVVQHSSAGLMRGKGPVRTIVRVYSSLRHSIDDNGDNKHSGAAQ